MQNYSPDGWNDFIIQAEMLLKMGYVYDYTTQELSEKLYLIDLERQRHLENKNVNV